MMFVRNDTFMYEYGGRWGGLVAIWAALLIIPRVESKLQT